MQALGIFLALCALISCGRCYLLHGCTSREGCSHHGLCEFHIPFSVCKCEHGYFGSTCKYRDPCVFTHPCQHDGRCEFREHASHGHRHYVCHCQDGYQGTNCQYSDPCVFQKPCQNGAACHFHYTEDSEHHHYTCDCPQGTNGHDCDVASPATTTVAQSVVQTSTAAMKASSTTVAPTSTHMPTTPATPLPMTTTTTPVKTTTATITPHPIITTMPLTTSKQYTCVTMKTITDLANNVTGNNGGSSSCNHGDNAGSEALVLNNCDVQQPASWVPGKSAVSVCSSLPVYTPIATFTGGAFQPGTDTSAIFLGCLGDQIRVGLQTCDGGTRIEHLSTSGTGYMDASLYHVIQ